MQIVWTQVEQHDDARDEQLVAVESHVAILKLLESDL